MSPGDLVRIKNAAGTRMFYPEIVGKVGVLISVEGASAMPEAVKVIEFAPDGTILHVEGASAMPEAVKVLEVLVREQIMLLALEYLEPV